MIEDAQVSRSASFASAMESFLELVTEISNVILYPFLSLSVFMPGHDLRSTRVGSRER